MRRFNATAFALLVLCSAAIHAFAQSSAFTYQGRLTDNAVAANGSYEFRFALFDAASGGTQVGQTLTNSAVIVSSGTFTVTLDFGAGAFPGANRWLQIGVRTNGSGGAFTTLNPRQPVTSTPYALTASDVTGANIARLSPPNTAVQATGTPVITSGFITSATLVKGGSGYFTPPLVTVNDTTGSGAIIIANISGGSVSSLTVQNPGSGYSQNATLTITPPESNAYQTFAGLNYFGGVNHLTNSGNTIVGNGSGLNNLNAASLSSGTLSDARLSANVPLLGANQTFSGINTLNHPNNSFAGDFAGNGSGLANVNAATLQGLAASNFWRVNTNTTSDATTIGPTNNQALELIVNGQRALRIEPNTNGAPNIIGGAPVNYVGTGVIGATIGGGAATNYFGFSYTNRVTEDFATVAGGRDNTAAGFVSTVSGGAGNIASFHYATVGGGDRNLASSIGTTVGGGERNSATDIYATVGGGVDNHATGSAATIPGGYNNVVAGANSFAAGRNCNIQHHNCFMWSDGTLSFSTTAPNSFNALATGGYYLYSSSGVGVQVAPGGNSWSGFSDRNGKENFKEVNCQSILEKVVSLPITTWNLKTQSPDIRHIGPMAQDFQAAFKIGEDDRHIGSSDADGVALAAIQGLNQKLEEEMKRNRAKDAEISELKQRLSGLEKLLRSSVNTKE
jgi:trimeric autotransporter adhesin